MSCDVTSRRERERERERERGREREREREKERERGKGKENPIRAYTSASIRDDECTHIFLTYTNSPSHTNNTQHTHTTHTQNTHTKHTTHTHTHTHTHTKTYLPEGPMRTNTRASVFLDRNRSG